MSTQVGLMVQWRDLMRSWGFTVHETSGWQTRDAEPGTSYDPSRMFLEHHDASTPLSGNWGSLAYVTANKLAQLVYSRDGQAMLVAAGVCWHAGVGGPFMDIPANQGNRYSMAVEVANSGSEAYDPRLTRLIIAGEAAWCIVMHREAARVRGHKEWATPPGRKQDPSVDMNQRRADVAAFIATGGDDDMPTSKEIAEAVWTLALPAIQGPNGPIGEAGGADFLRHAAAYATYAAVDANKTLVQLTAQQATIDKLVTMLAADDGNDLTIKSLRTAIREETEAAMAKVVQVEVSVTGPAEA